MSRSAHGSFGLVLAALLAPGAAAGADVSPFINIVQSPFVHCAFYRSYDLDPVTGDRLMVEGRSQSLTHFQGIRDGRARQISTRIAGARDVKVVNGPKYLHFIDEMEGLFVFTTVYGCIDRDARRGVCVTYGAVQSRHFDARVLYEPDAVYDDLKDYSDPGFCDHSFLNLKEAASGKQ